MSSLLQQSLDTYLSTVSTSRPMVYCYRSVDRGCGTFLFPLPASYLDVRYLRNLFIGPFSLYLFLLRGVSDVNVCLSYVTQSYVYTVFRSFHLDA